MGRYYPPQERKTFYAVEDNEIIPCHLIGKRERDERGKYAANGRKDRRRFKYAYKTMDMAIRIRALTNITGLCERQISQTDYTKLK